MIDLSETVGVEMRSEPRVCQYRIGHGPCCGAKVHRPHAPRGLSGSYCETHLKLLSTPLPKRSHRSADKTQPQQRKHTARTTNPAAFDFRRLGITNPTNNW